MIKEHETLVTKGTVLENASLHEFLRWAFSDLRMNDTRGVFAEWMVGKILELDMPPRSSWDCCDLRLPDGKGVEVKAASYVQAWDQSSPSKIIFSGLKGRIWNPETNYSKTQTYNAEVYVFCLQIERDPDKWNALDLDQWRFYVLPRHVLEDRSAKQISLEPLRKLAKELRANELKGEVFSCCGLMTW